MAETIVQDAEFDVLMTGEESYPIIGLGNYKLGNYKLEVSEALKEFKGLPLYAGCWEKAIITQRIFGGQIEMGSMKVFSGDMSATYGFEFNPPTELHCWVRIMGIIVDLSLPGVIMRGLKLSDEIGPFLEGRVPSVLVGKVPDWILYRKYQTGVLI